MVTFDTPLKSKNGNLSLFYKLHHSAREMPSAPSHHSAQVCLRHFASLAHVMPLAPRHHSALAIGEMKATSSYNYCSVPDEYWTYGSNYPMAIQNCRTVGRESHTSC
ncbi:unnamed protein product [Prunus armeniaca]